MVLAYTEGKMGVSAVPGSGKTWTLSYLAAKLVASGLLKDEQEVLIVTLVNAAVHNFSSRVGNFVQAMDLLPNLGYRVRTLHGLAHDIVRERPELAGLSDDFQIIDERAASEILQEAAEDWLRGHPHALDDYLDADIEGKKLAWVQREHLPELVSRLATIFVKHAKDFSLTPVQIRGWLAQFGEELPLMTMGLDIYTDYQRALAYRGQVDFDDLIRLALQSLKLDRPFLERLRARWPYILEDEAQDSSRLQEQILECLAGEDGNWVRVGDPNQAIYETFTTASPDYLRAFIERPGVQARELPESGRSTQSIIDLANHLITWTREAHIEPALQDALRPPFIRPTPPDDPQANPSDTLTQVYFSPRRLTPAEEAAEVVKSLVRWLPQHQDQTVAVLVPRNRRGFAISNALRAKKLEVHEQLRTRKTTRDTAGALGNIVNYLADPASSAKLARVYQVWRRDDREDVTLQPRLKWVSKTLRQCRNIEDFLWPRVDRDWLANVEIPEAPWAENATAAVPVILNEAEGSPEDADVLSQSEWHSDLYDIKAHLMTFRDLVQRWQAASLLPIDQLILTLAQDLFERQDQLAIAHKLAVVLRRAADLHPAWRLPELTQELADVARNERKFLGLSDEDIAFDPDAHKGEVVVTTMHQAKGMEWDRVYLMSLNNYDFPSAQPYDHYISERWFIRGHRGFPGHLNLEAEILAQLDALRTNPDLFIYDEGQATEGARLDYAAERLRLLYVGITRARKELIVTWNTGRQGEAQPALPFVALQSYWSERKT
jgi:DNA helicase-2/ATP-dependent DNA helicase PcrA